MENTSSLVLGDETYCEGLKAQGLEDVQGGVFEEEAPKQRDPGPGFHFPQIPELNEGDLLVILHGLTPFEGPDCV